MLLHQIGIRAKIAAEGCSGVADKARKYRFADANFGENEAPDITRIAIEGKIGVKRKLHVVGTWAVLAGGRHFPHARRNVARFVIDDEKRIVDEAVDAVEPQMELEAGDRGVGFCSVSRTVKGTRADS